MKDATATALYGARGANGVILVTTKQGTAGRPKVSVRVEQSVSTPRKKVKLTDPVNFMKLNNEAVNSRRDPNNPAASANYTVYSQEKIENTIAGTNPYYYPAVDWYDELFNDYALSTRVNANLSGGGSAVRYYVAASYTKNVYGPYEWKTVLAQGNSPVNGPHQGAWVDTPTGEDWFLHFQDVGAYGRIMHLQPMKWINDWPVIGVDKDGDGCGEPVLTYKKPNVGKTYPICTPQESDEFDGYTLSPQWQWHANINEKWAYYAGDKSYVRLYSYPVVQDYKNMWDVANLLLQKTPSDNFTATMKLTFTPNQKNKGERTGLIVMGRDYAGLFLENTDKGLTLSQVECKRADKGKPEQSNASVSLTQNTVYLKAKFKCDGKKIKASEGGHDLLVMCDFSYSLDGKKYQPLGNPFQAREGQWIGTKIGTFCTRPAIVTNDGGWVDVDWFRIAKK